MSTWSLRHDDHEGGALTQTIAEWGFSNGVLKLASLAPSTLALTCAGDFDAAHAIAYGDRVSLLLDGVVQWRGKARQLPLQAQGSEESRDFVFEDLLGDFARRAYMQTWANVTVGETLGDVLSPSVILFADDAGGGVSISLALADIVSYAAARGIDVQMGDALNMSVNPRKLDARSMTLLEVLRQACKFAPDVATRIDYSATPPTLHFVRRVDATEHDVEVIEAADSFAAAPLHDQVVNAVVLIYDSHTTSGAVVQTRDIAPEGADGTEENALVCISQLQPRSGPQAGEHRESVTLETIGIASDLEGDLDWWANFFPWFADRGESAVLSDVTISTEDYSHVIIGGSAPAWQGSHGAVEISATFNGLVNGIEVINRRLSLKLNCTTLSSGTFTRISGGGSTNETELAPTGLASLLHGALSVLHWQGSHVATMAELSLSIRPGDVVNFTGTDRAELTTARAQIQAVELNLDTGLRTLTFGPPAFLNFGDLIELYKLQRDLREGSRAAERAGDGLSYTQSAGPALTPSINAQATDSPPTHPFQVIKLASGANDFRVIGGTIDGVAIASQTVSIGSGRPKNIFVKAEYTLDILDSEYVETAAIRTDSGHTPVFTTLKKDTGDVTAADVTTITDAGDEARCLIAVIEAGDSILQLATENIVATLEDDGSGSGQAHASFAKG